MNLVDFGAKKVPEFDAESLGDLSMIGSELGEEFDSSEKLTWIFSPHRCRKFLNSKMKEYANLDSQQRKE